MVVLSNDDLEFSFPKVHPEAKFSIDFQRTLRLPDDNRSYPLPPGLGSFPLLHVEDFAKTCPETWNRRGGVFLPMYQSEALWINFSGSYPCAVKIAAGKINAVTGEPWQNGLSAKPQDYLVVPDQPWLDGFCVGEGLIRQFVAMPLGQGFTAEEQLTGTAEVGGIQLSVYPMKKEVYEEWAAAPRRYSEVMFSISLEHSYSDSMGLAPGGLMQQQIYEDEHGMDAWQTDAMSRCFVHLANSEKYLEITGYAPPTQPPTAKEYTKAGMPWFDYYAADKKVLQGSKTLAGMDSIAAKMVKVYKKVLKENDAVEPARVVSLGSPGRVSDGIW